MRRLARIAPDVGRLLTDYEMHREAHTAREGRIELPILELKPEMKCPICLEILTDTMTTKECLHRFCEVCITKSLQVRKECPTCREKVPSRRSLRKDENFDRLIAKLYPDRGIMKAREQHILERIRKASNQKAYQDFIDEGLKATDANRRKYRTGPKLAARQQISKIQEEEMGLPPAKRAKKKEPAENDFISDNDQLAFTLAPRNGNLPPLDRPYILTVPTVTCGHLRKYIHQTLPKESLGDMVASGSLSLWIDGGDGTLVRIRIMQQSLGALAVQIMTPLEKRNLTIFYDRYEPFK